MTDIHPSVMQYYLAAKHYLLPAEIDYVIDGCRIDFAGTHFYFFYSCNPFNTTSSSVLSSNKFCANKVLEEAGIPVPKAVIIHLDEYEDNQLSEIVKDLTYPLVAKPALESSKGKNVFCNIQNFEQLNNFCKKTFPEASFLIIEEFHGGLNSYRVLLFNQKIIGVVLRYPARLTGDGKSTLAELLQAENNKRELMEDYFAPIEQDEEFYNCIAEQQVNLDSVLPEGKQIFVNHTCNANRGGTYETKPLKMCKANKRLFQKAANILNINLVGFDVECRDLTTPIADNNGVFIEANQSPSVLIHEFPMSGKPNFVTRKIIRHLIKKHPFAYLKILATRPNIAFYLRLLFVFAIVAIVLYLTVSWTSL